MKKLILTHLIFLLTVRSLTGQSESEKRYFAEKYVDTFSNESVVVVKDYEEYRVTPYQGIDYKVNVVFRTQYKLNDISALESFNTLSKSKGLKKIYISQVKPDGNIHGIYVFEDKAYEEERSPYTVYLNEGDDKLAVENLEIGDIIDYRYEYTYTTTVYPRIVKEVEYGYGNGSKAYLRNHDIYRKLPDFTKFLQGKYPTVTAQYVIEIPQELKLLQKAVNCHYKFRQVGNVFKCNIGMTPAFKKEYFSYTYIDLPVLKFCIIQNDDELIQHYYPYQFMSETVTNRNIADLGRAFYRNKRFIPYYLYYTDKRYYPTGLNETFLGFFFNAFLKTFTQPEEDKLTILNKFHEFICNNDELNNWQFGKMNFAVLLSRFCDKIKQPYLMMACLPKYDSKWKDVIHPSEITWGIFIENGDNDLFISSNEPQSNIYERDGAIAETEVVLFNTKDLSDPVSVICPAIGYEENRMTIRSDVTFSDVSKNYDYHLVNTYIHAGSQKSNLDEYIAYKFYPRKLSTNAGFYGIVSDRLYNNEMFKDTSRYMPEIRRISASFDKKSDEDMNRNFEKYLNSEYHFDKISIDSISILEGEGYADDEKSLNRYRIGFNTGNIIEKTANNQLVLKLGRLITEQMELSNFKNDERISDIHITNQRKIEWLINIELPADFQPLNLQDFNQTYENICGSFKAVVIQNKNVLNLHIEKIYNINYLPREKWQEMTAFLRQAALYYEKQLVLIGN